MKKQQLKKQQWNQLERQLRVSDEQHQYNETLNSSRWKLGKAPLNPKHPISHLSSLALSLAASRKWGEQFFIPANYQGFRNMLVYGSLQQQELLQKNQKLMHHHQHISKACGFFVFQKEAGKSRGGSTAAVVSSSSYLESFMAFLENQFTCKNIFEMILFIP